MSAPDVAALLAQVETDLAWLRFEKRLPYWAQQIDALATALRAALADQRRIDWLEANSRYFSGAIEMDHDSRLNGDALSLRAAIDAALTADGGV